MLRIKHSNYKSMQIPDRIGRRNVVIRIPTTIEHAPAIIRSFPDGRYYIMSWSTNGVGHSSDGSIGPHIMTALRVGRQVRMPKP